MAAEAQAEEEGALVAKAAAAEAAEAAEAVEAAMEAAMKGVAAAELERVKAEAED